MYRSDPPPRSALQLGSLLIVKLSSIGDVVHALPVASALRRRYPSLRITWAVEDWAAALVTGHPAIDRVVAFPRMREPRKRRRWLRAFRDATKCLQAESYDVALDLQGLLKSSVVVLLSRARLRLGSRRQREGARFISRPVPAPDRWAHVVDEHLDCAEFLGAARRPVSFQLPVEAEATRGVDQLLREAGVAPDVPLIAINPCGSTARRTLPAARWVELADRLAELGTVVLPPGPQRDVQRNAAIARRCRAAPLDLTGRTPLAELVAVLGRCAVHVAPDTGSAHIAAALGRPVVGIYGPTPVWRQAPWQQGDRVVHHQDQCGVGCPRFCPRGRRCLQAVTTEEIFLRVRRVLGQSGSERVETVGCTSSLFHRP